MNSLWLRTPSSEIQRRVRWGWHYLHKMLIQKNPLPLLSLKSQSGDLPSLQVWFDWLEFDLQHKSNFEVLINQLLLPCRIMLPWTRGQSCDLWQYWHSWFLCLNLCQQVSSRAQIIILSFLFLNNYNWITIFIEHLVHNIYHIICQVYVCNCLCDLLECICKKKVTNN